MRKCKSIVLSAAVTGIILLLHGIIYAQQQRISTSQYEGSASYLQRGSTHWLSFDKNTPLSDNYTVKTGQKSEVHFTLEPAITAILHENSMLSFDKLLLNTAEKTIRTVFYLQNGALDIKMPAHLGYKLLFTIKTPSAHIYIRNADVKVFTENSVTRLDVFRGSAKISHNANALKTIVYENSSALLKRDVSSVQISKISDIPFINQRNPSHVSVAILSIHASTSDRSAVNNLEPLSDFVAQSLESQSNTEVLFLDNVRSMLRAEGIEGLLNCTTDSCISHIGNFIGVDLVVIGKLGQVGSKYLFNLKLVDVLKDRTRGRISVAVDGDMGLILNEIPTMIDTLVNQHLKPVTASAVPADFRNKIDDKNKMVWIEGGSFYMGAQYNDGELDELPLHKVTVSGFYMDTYEITKEEFQLVMGHNPSRFKGCEECPVDNISWFEAKEFCEKIGKRLPTEAEWEYACRAETKTAFHYGNTLSSDQANFNGQYPYGGSPSGGYHRKPLPVGSFQPNAWGLYDMHGNVWEWCSDWYDVAYYGNSPQNNPSGPSEGKYKVARGGAWNSDGASLRSSNRISYAPIIHLNTIGFRCVKDPYVKKEQK